MGYSKPKTTLYNVRDNKLKERSLKVKVKVYGYKIEALVDSGAAWTVILPRVVEKYNIPY
jgi:predicted aspartyl protease